VVLAEAVHQQPPEAVRDVQQQLGCAVARLYQLQDLLGGGWGGGGGGVVWGWFWFGGGFGLGGRFGFGGGLVGGVV